MIGEKFSDLDVDVYMILSHPLRRRILTHLYHNYSISFSIMSKEWKYVTGTIYHHLKLLGKLIEQNKNQEYQLTDLGKQVCEWFISSNSGKVTVSRIEAINSSSFPGITLFEKYWKPLLIIFTTIFVISLPVLKHQKIIILGPLLIKSENERVVTIWNITGFFLFPALFFLMLLLIHHRPIFKWKLLIPYIIPICINAIFILSFSRINDVQTIHIGGWALILIMGLQQILFLTLLSSLVMEELNYSPERSILLSIINLYLILFVTFLIIL